MLRNAIKYSPQGGEIAIELAYELSGASGWAVIKSCATRASASRPDDLPRIFERFHRGGNVAGQIQGTGIGLSSALQIVEQHGGTISVVSEERVGSIFTVRLPLEPTSSRYSLSFEFRSTQNSKLKLQYGVDTTITIQRL